MADEERSIFIDSDWKARVQREKEEARRKAEEEAAKPDATTVAPNAAPQAVAPGHALAGELPEDMEGAPGADEAPSFLALVSSLAAQTMFALGVLVPRDSQQVYVNLEEARYTIELVAILREKTQGNLTPEESAQLEATLAELQQVFVARVQQAREQAMRQAGIDPTNLQGGPPAR
jgi:hypothetical protein